MVLIRIEQFSKTCRDQFNLHGLRKWLKTVPWYVLDIWLNDQLINSSDIW